MSAPLISPLEIIANEITRLEQRKNSLLASIKAEESRLKDLRENVHIRQVECTLKIEQAQAAYEEERVKLSDTLHPLKSELSQLRSNIYASQKELDALRSQIEAAIREKEASLNALNTKITRASDTYASLSETVKKLKHAIADI
jgi:chromosome segregation ATPase